MNYKFQHGETVKDIVTGFAGVITGRADYITGCNQYSIIQRAKTSAKEYQEVEGKWFDETRLELVKRVKRLVLPDTMRNMPTRQGGPQTAAGRPSKS